MALASHPILTATRFLPSQMRLDFKWRGLLFSSVALPFNMQHQTQSNWCWAATSTSTSLFYRPSSTWTQCKVANAELGLTGCCNSPVPGPCNVPWYLDRALSRTQNFVSLTGPISFQAVQSELQAGRVLGARIGWSGGGGHFMTIYGCGTANGVQYFNIDDPIYGKSSPSVSTFSHSYQGSGTWTTTYFTKAAPMVFRIPYEISESLIKPIWEARPLLMAQVDGAPDAEDESADTQTSFSLAHPIHVLGLRDLVEGKAIDDRPVAIRVLETRGDRLHAFYDLAPESDAPRVLQMAARDNDYGERLQRGLDASAQWAGSDDAPADLRLLRIPALYTEALVLSREGSDEQVAVVIRSPQEGVPLFTPIPLSELTGRLTDAAHVILADDDPLKGS